MWPDLEIGSLKIIKLWEVIRMGSNPMTMSLSKGKICTYWDRCKEESQCEDSRKTASMCWKKTNAWGHHKLEERPGTDSQSQPSKGTIPTNTLISGFWLSEPWGNPFLLFKPPVCGSTVTAALGARNQVWPWGTRALLQPFNLQCCLKGLCMEPCGAHHSTWHPSVAPYCSTNELHPLHESWWPGLAHPPKPCGHTPLAHVPMACAVNGDMPGSVRGRLCPQCSFYTEYKFPLHFSRHSRALFPNCHRWKRSPLMWCYT